MGLDDDSLLVPSCGSVLHFIKYGIPFVQAEIDSSSVGYAFHGYACCMVNTV